MVSRIGRAAGLWGATAEEEDKGPFEMPIDDISGWMASFEWIRQHFGLLAAIVVAVLVVGGFVWWNWEDFAKRPGVKRCIEAIRQRIKPLPKASAEHLSIALTHLARDNNEEHEVLVADELGHFEGVEILRLDRTLDEESGRQKAEEEAQRLLRKTGADVLVWGTVISLEGKSAMRLYWTPSRNVSGAKFYEKYQLPKDTVTLPDAFWEDLKQIMGLLAQSRLAEISFGQPGQFIAAKLEPLIRQVRALVEKKEGVWNPETLAGVQFGLATALAQYGEQLGK